VKQRPLLYIETSVFGFYYDEEQRNALRREAVRTMFRQISMGMLDADDAEVSRLAGLYVEDGVIPAAETLDTRHAAYATVARADIIVSLNLKHLANAWAEQRLNAVNSRAGLPTVRIWTPEQVVHYED